MKPKAKTKQSQQVWKNRERKRASQETIQVKQNVKQEDHLIQTPTQLLDQYLETKGIQFILEAIQEKEARSSTLHDRDIVERTAKEILQAVTNALPTFQISTPIERFEFNSQLQKKPDIDKLKGLL